MEGSALLTGNLNRILQDASGFELALSSCLKLVGEHYDVDRVSIFSFHQSKESFLAQEQWSNSHVQEYHPADLTISELESPLASANYGHSFASSDLKRDIAASLADKFEIFSVQSLLIIPIAFSHYKRAMLVMESCAFKREWYDFEVKEIEQVVSLMCARLDALWHKSNAARVWYLNSLRNQIFQKVKANKRTKKSINEALKIIGSDLGLRSVYVIDKNSFSNGHELSWTDTAEHEEELLSNQDLEKLNLNKGEAVPRYFTSDSLKKSGVDVKNGTNFLLVNRVSVGKEFGGWLVGEYASYQNYNPNELVQFWESVSLALSEILSSTDREHEHNVRYSELLEQNKELITKEFVLDKVLNDAPLGILIISNGKFDYVNQYAVQLSGYDRQDIVGRDASDFYGSFSEVMSKKMKRFYKGVESNGIAEDEIQIANKDKDLKRLKIYGTRGLDDEGKSFMIFAQDITESYESHEKIRESRERYQKIVESAIDGALIIDANHGVRYVNKSTCDILGRQFDDFATLSSSDIVHKKNIHEFDNAIRIISEGKEYRGDMVLCKKDGEKVEVELAGTLIYMDNQSYCYFTIHDISKRRKNEKALVESEREFRTLTQNSPDIILRLNKAGEVKFFNQAFVNRFSFLNPDKILDKTLLELGVFDEVVEPTWQMKVNDVFLFGETVSVEQGFSDDVKELYFDWILSPEKNEEGEVQTIIAVGRNLTSSKSTEKELMLAKEKAEESDKLKSEFLANISHELRTPLNAIVGFSSLLRGSQAPQSELDEYVDVIHKNSDSLMSMINNIIDVAKIESGKISVVKEKVDLDKVLQGLYDDFLPKIEIEHKGRVKLYYTKPAGFEGLKLMTDPIRLRQVLVNLIGNAVKFTIKGFVEFGFVYEGEGLRFFVKDTGIGIRESKQRVIFQPFSKGEDDSDKIYGGTGIGLAISEKLVNALGGEIGLHSEKGKGSEFFFTHPIDGGGQMMKPESVRVAEPGPILAKNYRWSNKMMLLVDENSSSHLQMRKFIEKTGITLVSARTAAGASKLLMNRTDIHLVLMDVSFPDSDGYELVKTIKRLNKGLPVIVHSAKAIGNEKERLIAGGFDACIAKPADKENLLALMDQFLVEA